jgi:hypothetical protein
MTQKKGFRFKKTTKEKEVKTSTEKTSTEGSQARKGIWSRTIRWVGRRYREMMNAINGFELL